MTKDFTKVSDSPVKAKVKSVRNDFFARSPTSAALATKLIKDTTRSYQNVGDGAKFAGDDIFYNIIYERAKKDLDAESLMELLTDFKIVKEIIISTIISPINMEGDELILRLEKSTIPGALLNELLDEWKDHAFNYLKINDDLPERIDQAMWMQGASVRIIIPEANIDDIINDRVSLESEQVLKRSISDMYDHKAGVLKPVGILGSANSNLTSNPSLESYFNIEPELTETYMADGISITDNIQELKLPILMERYRKRRLLEKTRPYSTLSRMDQQSISLENEQIALEQEHFINDKKEKIPTITNIGNALFKDERSNMNSTEQFDQIRPVYQTSRPSIGHPLVMAPLAQSMMCVFSAGNPKDHKGYILILDEFSKPINLTLELKGQMQNGFMGAADNNSMDMTSSLIQQTRIQNSGYNWDSTGKYRDEERHNLFMSIMDENIINRIRSGLMGHNVELGRNEESYLVMLLRKWRNKRVKMVFVPKEQVSYLAYDYDDNGIGRSFMDGIRQIASIRAMTNFANFFSAVSNAVGRTKVRMNIDPRSPDPEKDYNIMMDQYLRGIANIVPTDVTNSADMFRVIRQMGVFFETTGNTRLPETTVEIEEGRGQKQPIDSDFVDELRRLTYAGLYVTPEMVDMTNDTDFAISRWTSNQLYSKRARGWQKTTCLAIKDFGDAYQRADGTLLKRYQEIIDKHKERIPPQYILSRTGAILYSEIIEEFIRVTTYDLPAPNNTKFSQQMEALNQYIEVIDVAIDAYLMEDVTQTAVPDDNGNYISGLKSALRSYFIRTWMNENNFMPELKKLVEKGDEDNPALNFSKETIVHITNLANNIGDWSAATKLRREKYLEFKEQQNPEYVEAVRGNSGGGGMSSDDNTENEDDSSSGDDFGDFGGDDSMEMPEFEAEETEPSETESKEEGSVESTESGNEPPSE